MKTSEDDKEQQFDNENCQLTNTNNKSNSELNNISSQNKQDLSLANSHASLEINSETSTFTLFKGFFFMFLSCLFRTATAISEKLILENNKTLTAFQLNAFTVYYMFVFTVVIFILALTKCINVDIPKSKSVIWFIISRSILAILVETMLVEALRYLPSSNVYSVYFLYPIVVVILATTFLGESFSFMDFLCLPFCLVGVALVVRPEFLFGSINNLAHSEANMHFLNITPINSSSSNSTNYNLTKIIDTYRYETINSNVTSSNHANEDLILHPQNIAHSFLYILVIIACCSKGTADFFIRKINSEVHFLVIPMAFSVIGILLFPLLPIIDQSPLPTFDLELHASIFINAVNFFSYMTLLAYALKFENAARVVMVNYLQLMFLFFADLFLFKKPFNILDLTGVILILGINCGNAFYKTFLRMQKREKLGEKTK